MKLLRKRKIILPKGFFLPNCGAFIVEIKFDSRYEKSARKKKLRDPQDEIVKLLVLTAEGEVPKFRAIMEIDNFVSEWDGKNETIFSLRELHPYTLRYRVAEFLSNKKLEKRRRNKWDCFGIQIKK